MIEYLNIIQNQLSEGNKIVLITVVQADGSSPGKPGFKMIVNKNGRVFGTVGGGQTEEMAIIIAKKLLKEYERKSKKTLLESYNLNKEDTDQIAICGGKITLYYEVFTPEKKVYIFGAGHVGSKTGLILKMMGFNVVMVDDRKQILEGLERAVYNKKIYMNFSVELEANIKKLNIENDAFVIILTHGHQFDFEVLLNIYKNYKNLKYIGMIGSVEKVKEIVFKIKKQLPDVKFDNLYSPIGINIGGNTAIEIAISIVAEIQSIIYGKEIKHLKIDYF